MTQSNFLEQTLSEIEDEAASLRRQIAALQDKLKDIEVAERVLAMKVGRRPKKKAPPEARQGAYIPSLNGSKFDGLTKHDAIAVVLREAGKPLKTADIDERLVAGGFAPHLSDTNRVAGIYLALMRKSKDKTLFKKVGRGLWDLIERTD